MTSAFVLLALAADPGPWKQIDQQEGITLYARDLPGEKFVELKATTVSAASVETLCTVTYGNEKLAKDEPNVTLRKLISKGENERVTYEQSAAPVVSDRDYAVRTTRESVGEGGCRVTFKVANEQAPAVPKGFVRIEKMYGSWTFEPQTDGKTKLTYLVFADPAGSIPAMFIEGPRKKAAFEWVKRVTDRAQAAGAQRDGGRD
jgi:hypothetical protein